MKSFCGYLIFSVLVLNQGVFCSSKITGKEYVSMPAIFHLDDFDRCMLYGEETLYCMIDFQLRPIDNKNISAIWKTIQEVNSLPTNYRHDLMRHGVCIPETCPNVPEGLLENDPISIDKFTECYNKKYKHMGLEGTIINLRCESQESPYPIDSYDIGVAVFVILYLLFVLFASFYEGIARYHAKEDYNRIISTNLGKLMTSFSIPANWFRFKSIDETNIDVQKLSCMQGVRFYSMLLVIISHTVLGNLGAPLSNVQYIEKYLESTTTMIIENGSYTVSTFFLIAAWLHANEFFTKFGDRKAVPVSYFVNAFLNRYLRLTPVLLFVIAIHSTWLVRLNRGPFWDISIGEEYRKCRKNWWTNILYISTYIDHKNMCLIHTWYMSILTQQFLLNLGILYLMWRYRKKIPLIIGSLVIIHMAIHFVLSVWNNMSMTIKPTSEDVYAIRITRMPRWEFLINNVYSNIPGLAGGLAYGYIYYKYKNVNFFTKKIHVVLWWFTVWGISLGITLIPGLIVFASNYQSNIIYESIFGSVSRVLYVFAIGGMIFGMSQGIGWMAKWTTEWRPLYPLGRLSYSTYLVHLVVIRVRIGARRSPTHISDMNFICDTVSDIVISLMMALVLTLLFEMPVSALHKAFIKKPESKVVSVTNNNVDNDGVMEFDQNGTKNDSPKNKVIKIKYASSKKYI